VYAVEASNMAATARRVVSLNDFQHIVSVMQQRIEDVHLEQQVDVIVSEWMGCFLYGEAMLDSVLYARDQWLKDGGHMLPSSATLYLAPISMAKFYRNNIWFLNNVHELDISPLVYEPATCRRTVCRLLY
jgi:hypothetical protein